MFARRKQVCYFRNNIPLTQAGDDVPVNLWIQPKFGQVSNLIWIFSVGQADCLTLCGVYDVYSNDRKTPKDCPDIF